MTKKTFKPFRLEDLTGGLNTKDYPSEIENKQATEIINFNFSGNKLVSEKGYEDLGLSTTPFISAIKIDGGNVWTIANNKIYKNGNEEESKNGVRLKVSGISKSLYKNIYDVNGNLVTKQLDEMEYFPDGVFYYIIVDGIEYKTSGASKNLIYENLSLLLINNGYTASISNDYLYISYNLPISVTIPNYHSYVVYLKDTISFVDPKWKDGWVRGFFYKIDGITKYVYNKATSSTVGGNAGAMDRYIRDQLFDSIDSLGLDIDMTKTYLSQGFSDDGTGTIISEEFDNGYASIIIQKADELSFSPKAEDLEGNNYNDDMIVVSDINSFFSDASSRLILRQGKVDEKNALVSDILALHPLLNVWDAIKQWILDNGFPNTSPFIVGTYSPEGSLFPNAFGIYPLDNNYKSASPIAVVGNGGTSSSWMALNEDAFDINTNTFENETINSILPNLGRSNIIIGNLGQLIINKDDGGAYYYTDDIMYEITEAQVGLPTVGTIYNGKIVLGGYADNDNIVFSQTSTPTQPLNLLNFEDYSAGGQSISGGDKGLITGMMVGENGLYVFKDDAVWYSNSEKDVPGVAFNLVFRKITSNGALSQNVITEVDQEIFYLDWRNRAVRRLGYEQNLTTLRDVSVSKDVSNEFKKLPENQPLATSHFSYPNYQLSLSSGLSEEVEYNNGNTYNTLDKHFIYNVENKSWTIKDGIDNMLVSEKGHFASNDGKIYIDFKGNTEEEGVMTSKLYTFGDDMMYKKFSRFDIVGQIIPETGKSKTLIVEIWIDGEKVDERTFTKTEQFHVREKIDLYDIGQSLQFKIKHSGFGSVEIYDAQIHYKGTSIQPQDYN